MLFIMKINNNTYTSMLDDPNQTGTPFTKICFGMFMNNKISNI